MKLLLLRSGREEQWRAEGGAGKKCR